MTDWTDYSAADFDARRAPKGAAKRAAEAAEMGQDGLFFTPTPVARPAKPAPLREEMPCQDGLFGPDDLVEHQDFRCPARITRG